MVHWVFFIVQPLVPQRLPCYDFALVLEKEDKGKRTFFQKNFLLIREKRPFPKKNLLTLFCSPPIPVA
jgi:hypothetical protein